MVQPTDYSSVREISLTCRTMSRNANLLHRRPSYRYRTQNMIRECESAMFPEIIPANASPGRAGPLVTSTPFTHTHTHRLYLWYMHTDYTHTHVRTCRTTSRKHRPSYTAASSPAAPEGGAAGPHRPDAAAECMGSRSVGASSRTYENARSPPSRRPGSCACTTMWGWPCVQRSCRV